MRNGAVVKNGAEALSFGLRNAASVAGASIMSENQTPTAESGKLRQRPTDFFTEEEIDKLKTDL